MELFLLEFQPESESEPELPFDCPDRLDQLLLPVLAPVLPEALPAGVGVLDSVPNFPAVLLVLLPLELFDVPLLLLLPELLLEDLPAQLPPLLPLEPPPDIS